MARYIDADALLKKIEKYSLSNGTTLGKHSGVADEIIDILIAEPTADVVPKSDAEKQKLEIWRLQGEVEQLRHKHELAVAEREANVRGFTYEISKAKTEVAMEIFDKVEDLCGTNGFHLICTISDFAELKKKYTEATDEV